MRAGSLSLFLIGMLPLNAAAQVIRGRVIDVASGGPPQTAVISLLTTDTSFTGRRVLADANGNFSLSAPVPGSYLVEVRSIGFRRLREPLQIGPAETRIVELRLSRNNVTLSGVRVEAHRSCRSGAQLSDTTAALWDDVWAALTASVIADVDAPARYPSFRYRREIQARTGLVLSEEREQRVGAVSLPFTAAASSEIGTNGFLHQDEGGNLELHAPDARTLLSPQFIAQHCFTATRDTVGVAPSLGIAFWPQRAWATRGIEGVFWMDAASHELRRIEFRYPGLRDVATSALRLGGEVRFWRDPSRGWLVSRWFIRAPVLQHTRRYLAWSGRRIDQEPMDSVLSVSEEGGVVSVDSMHLAALHGRVVASGGEALAGARVEALALSLRAAVSDSAGRFVLASLLPGRYVVRMDRAGSGDPQGAWKQDTIEVHEGEVGNHDFVVASARALSTALCHRGPSTTTAVYGIVRVAGSDRFFPNYAFDARWLRFIIEGTSQAIGIRTEVQTLTTDSSGAFSSCQLPPRADVSFRATSVDGTWTTPVRIGTVLSALELVVDSGGRIRAVNGATPVALASPNLADDHEAWRRLRGVVVSEDSTATPIPGVEVRVAGTSQSTTSGPDGGFVLDSLRAGLHVLTFRRLGFAPATEALVVDDGDQLQRVRLSPVATLLAGVLVSGAADAPSIGLREFRSRQRLGLGKFLGPEEFEGAGDISLSSLLFAKIQGFDFVPLDKGSLSAGMAIAARRFRTMGTTGGQAKPCFSQVFVDGERVSGALGAPWDVTQLKTGEIAAMEFYRGASETPTQFSGPSAACGTVVIWLRVR